MSDTGHPCVYSCCKKVKVLEQKLQTAREGLERIYNYQDSSSNFYLAEIANQTLGAIAGKGEA